MLRTPLHDAHVMLGAKLVDFAGWEMPVQYAGIIAESRAVREGAGMFDVSHMGRVWFKGEGAFDFLQQITSNDLGKLADWGSQYSLMCYENGTCVDDIIVYRIAADVFQVVINAANRDKDIAWMRAHMSGDVSFDDASDRTAMIAVQGPRAVEIVDILADEDITGVERFSAVKCTIAGHDVLACRTGYTGEDGFELILEAGFAEAVWDALAAAGVQPCGLASRDVLRVEAGLPLYGHELSDAINPIETGLGWVCAKNKSYIGSEAIERVRAEGPPRKLVGIRMESKIVPREGYEVRQNGERIGEVSSGVFSPILDSGIAFAFVDTDHATLDAPCSVVVRDKEMPATIVNKRFMRGG